MQFYSAQAFWTDPPRNQLDLTAVDLKATLDDISTQINKKTYNSSYDFDMAVTKALGSFRDGHHISDQVQYHFHVLS